MRIQRTIPPAAALIYLTDLLRGLSGIFRTKNNIRRFEKEIKEYFDVRHVFLVSSGKAAFTLILKALKTLSPDKNQVLIPAYTCFSVPSAIVKAGLKVSLCDIDISTCDFDHKLLKKAINNNTLCVIPSHLFGIPSEMENLKSLCKDTNTFIIEDAAQAMGGSYMGMKLGTIGDAGFFSLGRGKNITCGSGGIIVTNSSEIADAIEEYYSELESPGKIEVIREFLEIVILSIFINPVLYWLPAGLPFLNLGQTIFYKDFPIKKMSGMKAGLMWYWQRRLEQSNKTRVKTSDYFRERLGLKNNWKISVPHLRLPIIVNNRETRDQIYSDSQKYGLGISLMYPTAISRIEEIKNDFKENNFPAANKIEERLLAIPTHHLLSERDKKNICELFNKADMLDYFHMNYEALPDPIQHQNIESHADRNI